MIKFFDRVRITEKKLDLRVYKTVALYFRTPDLICGLCEKPLRSIFALRICVIDAKNRFALFSHSGFV
ncbi:hypothetical protein [Desulfonema magnum]|uniref:Transposase n=1 Tax=Desulfonema magnum TaxID=45655 RepID=A0A975BIB6_9BACT|nr:hypothetical protein [Desulfonema magnum]QTA85848.1 Uncharacterized protein dnm_018630 [Desulfonema magnum]